MKILKSNPNFLSTVHVFFKSESCERIFVWMVTEYQECFFFLNQRRQPEYKDVNWGNLEIAKMMSLLENSTGITIWDISYSHPCWGFGVTTFNGRKHKDGRIQLQSIKIRNEGKSALKISWAEKTNPVIQTKFSSAYFLRLAWPGWFLVHASENHK